MTVKNLSSFLSLPVVIIFTDSTHIGVLAAAAHAASSGGPFTIYYNPRCVNYLAVLLVI